MVSCEYLKERLDGQGGQAATFRGWYAVVGKRKLTVLCNLRG